VRGDMSPNVAFNCKNDGVATPVSTLDRHPLDQSNPQSRNCATGLRLSRSIPRPQSILTTCGTNGSPGASVISFGVQARGQLSPQRCSPAADVALVMASLQRQEGAGAPAQPNRESGSRKSNWRTVIERVGRRQVVEKPAGEGMNWPSEAEDGAERIASVEGNGGVMVVGGGGLCFLLFFYFFLPFLCLLHVVA